MEVFAVGKLVSRSSDGSARLLLYGLYAKKEDAEEFRQSFAEKYYPKRPCLSPMVVEAIKVKGVGCDIK